MDMHGKRSFAWVNRLARLTPPLKEEKVACARDLGGVGLCLKYIAATALTIRH